MDRKKIIWLLVALAVAGLTIWAVISQSGSLSLERLMLLIRTANPGWLALAFAAMLGFIVFEGEAVIVIAKSLGYKRSHRRGFVYSAADIYFSAITPSASGGQPASAYFMIKDGIPGPTTTVVLILNLVMYTLATLTIGVGAIIVSPGVFLHFSLLSKLLIIVGFVVIAFLALLFYMLLRKGEILYTGMVAFPADEKLREKAVRAISALYPDFSLNQGRICSGDQFIQSLEQKKAVVSEFGGICCDMEGAAIAQACWLNGVPWVVLRAISDKVDGTGDEQFESFADLAAHCSASVVLHMLAEKHGV